MSDQGAEQAGGNRDSCEDGCENRVGACDLRHVSLLAEVGQ
ncbi:hypothetical protein ACWGJX_10405 [Streptomyces sp. NPDC054775]